MRRTLNHARISGFEVLRLLSVAAVVGIHSFHTDPNLKGVAGNFSFAVPCFVLMAGFLACRQLDQVHEFSGFIQKRFARLMPAFFIWTGIYVPARFLWGNLALPDAYGWAEIFLFGSASLHLYFVPLLFYYGVILVLLYGAGRARIWLAACGFIIGMGLHLSRIYPHFNLGSPEADAFPFYFFYNLPYLFSSVLLFELMERFNLYALRKKSFVCIFFGILCAFLWMFPHFPSRLFWRDLCLFLTFLFWPARESKWISGLAAASFGVYLSHHLIIEGIIRLESFLGLASIRIDVTLFRFASALLVATTISVLLSKKKETAWLVR